MHTGNPAEKTRKNPRSALIKDPFIRLKIIEAKDVFLSSRKDVGDLYLRATYETEFSQKTNVVSKSSAPKWNSTWEFPYYVEEGQEGNAISISIYDADPLGSDELIATQFISLPHFKTKKQVGAPLDMWLKLHNVNSQQNEEAIVVETDASLYNDLNLPEFEDEIIIEQVVQDDDRVPKLHICLEIYDPDSINNLRISIPETEEFNEGGLWECKVFLYVIKVVRNDGLEWTVKKRYSQIRCLRQSLSERVPEVKYLDFPSKNMLKFTSKLFSGLDKDYKQVGVDRRKGLETFLQKIVKIEQNYSLQDFVKFFSEE